MRLEKENLADLYVLDALKGFGPQKFKLLWEAKITAGQVLRNPSLLPAKGKTGEKLRKEIANIPKDTIEKCKARAERQIDSAKRHSARILTYDDFDYPPSLLSSSHPVPIIYVRGNLSALQNQKAVACVGSRNIRPPYTELHRGFVQESCREQFSVVSGFALGTDTIGHQAALDCKGQTVCVMPCGLDRPFPPENRQIWNTFLEYDGAVFLSEFSFGTGASALTLRKRNKVIVALARGVLISQSSKTGGAMNAFRFALEQRKSVATFKDHGTDDTSGNLQIGSETKIRTVVFPNNSPEPDQYRQWLQELSSSI